jgi:hypothetical protein
MGRSAALKEAEMRTVLLSGAVIAAVALTLGVGTSAEAAKGPKTPEVPFKIHVYTESTDKDVVDSTSDVRRVIDEKKRDWFRLTDSSSEADIVLEITGRDFSQAKALIVNGRLSTDNVAGTPIVGQCIPGIFDVTGPWKSAAANMVKRIETYSRETYEEMAEAQKKKAALGSAASR